MRFWKSARPDRITGRPKPSKEVKELLMDFGDIVYRGKAVWLALSPAKLPPYLRGLDITREARRWVLVLTRRGRLVLRFKQGNTRLWKAVTAQA